MHSLWQTEHKTTEWHVSPAGKVKQGEIGSARQHRCDPNSLSLSSHRQRCTGTQAVQRTENVYTWTRMRSHLWEWSSRFSPLHFCTTLTWKEKGNSVKHNGTIVVHHLRRLHSDFLLPGCVCLSCTWQTLKSIAVVLHRCRVMQKIVSHSGKVSCETSL